MTPLMRPTPWIHPVPFASIALAVLVPLAPSAHAIASRVELPQAAEDQPAVARPPEDAAPGRGDRRPARRLSLPEMQRQAFREAACAGTYLGGGAPPEGLLDRIVSACDRFERSVETYAAFAAKEREAIFADRRLEPADEPPSEDFRRRMRDLEAKRPRLAALKAEVEALVRGSGHGDDAVARLEDDAAQRLLAMREAEARRVEAERKAAAEARRARKSAAPAEGEGR
jgi:hypothetical protein